MTSPKLVRALDSLFEGTITTVDQFPNGRPQPSWMEVVAFAKTSPELFVLTREADGTRCCRFTIRHFLCTISETDWRLIISGAVDRFPLVPVHGTPEDEAAELATVEILEERLQALIVNADRVAEKARQLKYRLGGRRAGLKSRQPTAVEQSRESAAAAQSRHPMYNLKEDLLSQFTAPSTHGTVSRPSATQSPQISESYDDLPSQHFVHELMYARVESLPKGGLVSPSCDLCRRRNQDCVKNATACEACTKKKAKCTWHRVTAGEAARLVESVKGPGPASHGLPSGSTPRRGTPTTPWSPAPPAQAAQQVQPARFDANSSSVRRSVEGSDMGHNKRPFPEPGVGQLGEQS
jgi:hypothetical protein